MSPTSKQFRAHLLAVLADLTERTAGIPVGVAATLAPVCARLNAHGHRRPETWAHQQIKLAGLSLCKSGHLASTQPDQWHLTDLGVQAHDVLAALEADGELVSVPQGAHPYDEDAYLRGLAVKQTTCFGAHVADDAACRACPLAAWCVVALDARLADLAVQLDVEDAKNRAATRNAAVAHEQNSSVDELLGLSLLSERETDTTPPPPRSLIAATTARSAVCNVCNKPIPKGEAALWSPDIGDLVHNDCRSAFEAAP